MYSGFLQLINYHFVKNLIEGPQTAHCPSQSTLYIIIVHKLCTPQCGEFNRMYVTC